MRIGYGKFARAWMLDPDNASTVGGDIDVARLLKRLAIAMPDDEFMLVGRCQKADPIALGYPSNVRNPWFSEGWSLPTIGYRDDLTLDDYHMSRDTFREMTKDLQIDALVLWIGQVANGNSPIPPSKADWEGSLPVINPQVMAVNYTLYLVDLCNRTGIEPILLCPDPRNYWKPRELTRPLLKPILAQFEQTRTTRHEQYQVWDQPWQVGHKREGSQITANVKYDYAGVELTALKDPSSIEFSDEHDRPHDMGIITNENAKAVLDTTSRLVQIKKYILENWDDVPLFGTWSEESQQELGRTIERVPYTEMYNTLRSFRCTMTFPASGSGWATAKPWEAFAVGTPMFFHHLYDIQGHILPRSGKTWKKLRKFLLVHNQRQLWTRAQSLIDDPGLFKEIVHMQRALFEEQFQFWRGGAAPVIERLEEERGN